MSGRRTRLLQLLAEVDQQLRDQLAGVTTATKMAKLQGVTWSPFLKLLDKTHPKYKPMPLFEDQE